MAGDSVLNFSLDNSFVIGTSCIELAFLNERLDSTGFSARRDIEEDLGIHGIQRVHFSELYYLNLGLEAQKVEEIAQKVFLDPIVQKYSTSRAIYEDYDYYVEVKLHPDVTDNLGIVAQEAIEDYTGAKLEGNVRSAKRYYLKGKIAREEIEQIARRLFANEIIETFTIGERNG